MTSSCGGSSCGMFCGKCGDFGSTAPREPELLRYEVCEKIFSDAVRNMTVRVAEQKSGMMSDGDFEEAKSRLVRWLVSTFSGENRHYRADDEWHLRGGLAHYLAERLNFRGHPPRQVLTRAAELFADQAEETALKVLRSGGIKSPAAARIAAGTVSLWCDLFTGVPVEYLERMH